MDSQSLLPIFFNHVVVDTPVGLVTGVLLRADRSQHGGIGCILIQTRSGWMLVEQWVVIKRRM